MKINWFSPLPPAKTGIALVTQTMIPALRKRAELTLWTDQQEWDRGLERSVRVRYFEPERPPWSELNEADLNFYNLGNSPIFHKGTWEVSRRHAGVVILHDLCFQHFFADLYLNVWKDVEAYRRVMTTYYGDSGRRGVEQLCSQAWTTEQLSVTFPLTPLTVENALGVVIHNRAGQQALTLQPQLPTFYLPLPYSPSAATQLMEHRSNTDPKPLYRLLVSGYLGPNRRLEPFLEAWAGMPEKAAFRLRVCGPVWDTHYIESRIRQLGLKDFVELCGYMTVEQLKAELRQADLAVNLRYPTMGEASLTQLMIWEQALPALVTEVGWYATFPRDTVAFVRPEHECEDICRQLRAFLENPQSFAEMGRRGFQTLQREHAPDHYAEAIVAMTAAARDWGLRKTRLAMAKRVGEGMRRWLTTAACDALTDRLASAIWEVSGGARTELVSARTGRDREGKTEVQSVPGPRTPVNAASFFEQTYRNLVERPNDRDWFHSMPLASGDRIAGQHADRYVQTKLWRTLAVDPSQKRVLDIGANDGFFTIAALLAGADEVTAINIPICPTYPENLSFAAKEWHVSPKIIVDDFQVHQFADKFDVIFFLGVLYHLENIFSAMRRLYSLLNEDGILYIETQMSQIQSPLPVYEGASDIYPTIAKHYKQRRARNFLFPNDVAMQNLAHAFDLTCERLEGIYTRDYPNRGVFRLTKLIRRGAG
jgi:predicted nicotinamide N-methyase